MSSASSSLSGRRVRIGVFALVTSMLSAVFMLLAPLPASAHDAMVDSSPPADSTIEVLPDEIVLTFSAPLIDGATEILVTGPSGQTVSDGVAAVSDKTVTQPLRADAEDGVYTVLWHVVSSDGHPTDGQFAFTLAGAPDAGESTPPAVEPTAEPSTEPTTVATPDVTATQSPDTSASSPASAWIWAISIAGVLAAAAVAVWLGVRSRARRPGAGSDDRSSR